MSDPAFTGRVLLASLAAGVTVAALVGLLLKPTTRLAPRLRPYTVGSRAGLGKAPDVVSLPLDGDAAGTFRRLLGPLIERLADVVGRLIDRRSDEALALRLRRSGLFPDVPHDRRVQEYRVRQLGQAVLATVAAVLVAVLLRRSSAVILVFGSLGFVVGVARWRARVDRAIEDRQSRMRIELYTVNQLLAMYLRTGGGVVQALRHIVRRGRGPVVEELAEVLRAHEAGMSTGEALERAAATTAEPSASRAYRVLATGAEYGADLANALLDLSGDVRDARREAMRRAATKRRAAMLIPIIAILAPVMLFFVAAPLPSLVFGTF
jgi:tight adherence protein C